MSPLALLAIVAGVGYLALAPRKARAARSKAKKGRGRGYVIVNGAKHSPPAGVTVVGLDAPNALVASARATDPRSKVVTELVLHRGAERKGSAANFAKSTFQVLEGRNLSTTFTMDVDGVIYQHFDPALRAGRHASGHNAISDSIDVAGPFDQARTPVAGQVAYTFKAAIGRTGDNKDPLDRVYGTVKCWTMTPAQVTALAAFVPWYCKLRGIPAIACDDWRTFRLSGKLGKRDPVSNVKGILAHAQISDPGRRVDGLLELAMIKQAGAAIVWRPGAAFFDT